MLTRIAVSILLSVALSFSTAYAQMLSITINSPHDGDQAYYRQTIEGAVSDKNAEVWVIVHPLEGSEYWVQPNVSVKENGTWKVIIYLGEAGERYRGKHFEIRAVANPGDKLEEGMILKGWPSAQSRSQVIELIRR